MSRPLEHDLGNMLAVTSDYSSGTSETSSEIGSEFSASIFMRRRVTPPPPKDGDPDVIRNPPSNMKKVPLRCPLCPFTNTSASVIRRHMACHSDRENTQAAKRSYICPHCNHASMTKVNYRRHVDLHFNFEAYLASKGIQIQYTRAWRESDTIEMEIINKRQIEHIGQNSPKRAKIKDS